MSNQVYTACSEADRIGNEPVGLPPDGVPVLTIRIDAKPRPGAELEAEIAAATEAIRSGKPVPTTKQYTPVYDRTAAVEMMRWAPSNRQDLPPGVDPLDEAANASQVQDHVQPHGWHCSLFPVHDDRVPTHWAPAPPTPLDG